MPSGSRLDSFYESRSEDRNFIPDGMAPGLRSTARNRDNSGLFSEVVDEPFNGQRPAPQQRAFDQMYPGPIPSSYPQQSGVGRNVSAPIQQPQYRGAPSPTLNQNMLQGGQQRLPPGLANLGGRPPHEPSHFFSPQMGIPSGGLHSASHGGGPSQPSYNNFGPAGGLSFPGASQVRAPPASHPVQSHLSHNIGGIGGPGNLSSVELRGSNQLLGMSGGGLRGGGGGGFGPQQGINGPMQGPLLTLRQQQQQQHLPPHMMPHVLPPHLQHSGHPVSDSQPASDLMALLMGNPHR
jgi:hypothetical protein